MKKLFGLLLIALLATSLSLGVAGCNNAADSDATGTEDIAPADELSEEALEGEAAIGTEPEEPVE